MITIKLSTLLTHSLSNCLLDNHHHHLINFHTHFSGLIYARILPIQQKVSLNLILTIFNTFTGQITLGPAASYMPLYSSDTAEDSSDLDSSGESSEEADSSDDDSVKEKKSSAGVLGGKGVGNHHINGLMIEDDDDDEELVDGAHVAQEMSIDLMKPLVVDEDEDEEDEEEEQEEDVVEEEEEEDFGEFLLCKKRQ